MILFWLLPLAGMVYASWRTWQLLPTPIWARCVVIALMIGLLLSMFWLFHNGLNNLSLGVATFFYEVSTSWLVIFLYLILVFLVLDVCKLFVPSLRPLLHHSVMGTAFVIALLVVIFVGANMQYRHKVRVPLRVTTSKALKKPLRVVLMSDLHLGYHNRRGTLARWVEKLNAEHADMILIGGDLIDISVRPLRETRMAEVLKQLNAPVYACLGNHEYYAGISEAMAFYRDAGITLLRDSVAEAEGVQIIGRDDRSNGRRLSLEQLCAKKDERRFTILLDHQPYLLEEAMQNGIDFQFSGHTHYGQVWPISWIERLLYEQAHGGLRKGATEYYVTSGLGIWGGKFRIGTRSEYLVMEIDSAHGTDD